MSIEEIISSTGFGGRSLYLPLLSSLVDKDVVSRRVLETSGDTDVSVLVCNVLFTSLLAERGKVQITHII